VFSVKNKTVCCPGGNRSESLSFRRACMVAAQTRASLSYWRPHYGKSLLCAKNGQAFL